MLLVVACNLCYVYLREITVRTHIDIVIDDGQAICAAEEHRSSLFVTVIGSVRVL